MSIRKIATLSRKYCQMSTKLAIMILGATLSVRRDGLFVREGLSMAPNKKLRAYLYGSVAPVLFGAVSLASTGAFAACNGPGAPSTTQTKCVTAIRLPKPLQSYDISW